MLCPSPPCPPLPPEERGGTLLPSPFMGEGQGVGEYPPLYGGGAGSGETADGSCFPSPPHPPCPPLPPGERGGTLLPSPIKGEGQGVGEYPPFMGEGQGVGKQQTVLVSLLPLTPLSPSPTRGEGGNTAPLPLYGGGTGGGGISPLYGGGTGGGRDSRRFSSPSSSLTPLPPFAHEGSRGRWVRRRLSRTGVLF